MLCINYMSIKLRKKPTLARCSITTCKRDRFLGNAGGASVMPNDLLHFLSSVLSFSHLLYLQTWLVRSARNPLCAMIPWWWSWTLSLCSRLLSTLCHSLGPNSVLAIVGSCTNNTLSWIQALRINLFTEGPKNRANYDQSNLLKVQFFFFFFKTWF